MEHNLDFKEEAKAIVDKAINSSFKDRTLMIQKVLRDIVEELLTKIDKCQK